MHAASLFPRVQFDIESPMAKVTVIGAGPAGCVTAIVLARAGVQVSVVEQHRFPREKVCGECLSTLAIQTLEGLGVASTLKDLGPAVLREARIHTVNGATYPVKLPGVMWGVSRAVLDAFLLAHAAEAGAEVLQPARCEGVEGPGVVRVRDLVSNEVRKVEGDWVVVAEGKGGRSQSPAPATGDLGIKAHFEDVDGPRDVIELFGVRGAYGGLAAIERGIWNAAFSVPGKWLREFGGDVEGLFARVCGENPVLGRRMSGARRVGQWLAAPLPRFGIRRKWAEVVPVGNAAAAIEPIGGEGMGLAMKSGEMAARFLLSHAGRGGLDELFAEYERLWRVRRVACRAAAVVVSRPWASRLVLPGLRVAATARVSLSLMGKGRGRASDAPSRQNPQVH
jgi:flavin-dependent dehydrogenase